jgi:dihydropteroate synthase
MSKIKALITTLVLATSSIAAAAPGVAFKASTTVVRDHRVDARPLPAMYRIPARPAWIALSSPTQLAQGRNAIKVATPSRYSQLRLQATAGSSYIKSITIRFADGTKQNLAINKTLDARSPMVELPVSSRASVQRVVIKGSTNRRASVQLFGTRALVAHR